MAMRDEYEIEGYRVTWRENVGGGYSGWACECWQEQPPKLGGGRKPGCRHTLYVEHQLFRHLTVQESGPRVVTITDRRMVQCARGC